MENKNGKQLIHSFNHTENFEGNFNGLTKREYFALSIMNGLLSCGTRRLPSEVVKASVELTDKLLKALEDGE